MFKHRTLWKILYFQAITDSKGPIRANEWYPLTSPLYYFNQVLETSPFPQILRSWGQKLESCILIPTAISLVCPVLRLLGVRPMLLQQVSGATKMFRKYLHNQPSFVSTAYVCQT